MYDKRDLKTILFLIIILNIDPGICANNFGVRCKKPKAYAFCGSHTYVGTQWFFDSKHSKCLPYKYCISTEETQIPEDSTENRFESEKQCQYVCKLKKMPRPWKKQSKNALRLGKLRGIGKFGDGRRRDPVLMKKMSHFESRDPTRCMRPKSYSFCGSHTIPHTHWYYNKRTKRCLPYSYCEAVGSPPLMNHENNFYTEKQCHVLCHF